MVGQRFEAGFLKCFEHSEVVVHLDHRVDEIRGAGVGCKLGGDMAESALGRRAELANGAIEAGIIGGSASGMEPGFGLLRGPACDAFAGNSGGGGSAVQAMMAVDKDWARKRLSGLNDHHSVGGGNAVIAYRNVDVAQSVFGGEGGIGNHSIHAEDGFYTQVSQGGESGVALWRRPGINVVPQGIKVFNAVALDPMKFAGRGFG